MVRAQGAVIEERGVTFGIVVVKGNVVSSTMQCQKATYAFQP